jgi:phosphoglycolate phosphatase
MKYDLCLFDLDGTLTDPHVGITKSYQYALSAFGIHEELDNLKKFIGPPLRDVFRDYYEFSATDTEMLVTKFREYFAETGLLENDVYLGIREMLERLQERGVVMAVATSKVTVYAARIIKHFQLDGYFSFISGDDMDGSLTKEGKCRIIQIALDALDPEHKMAAAIIGDREHDIIGGSNGGELSFWLSLNSNRGMVTMSTVPIGEMIKKYGDFCIFCIFASLSRRSFCCILDRRQ